MNNISKIPQHRHFDSTGLKNMEVIKAFIWSAQRWTPQAFVLGVILGTFWNDSSGQGSLHPTAERLTAYLPEDANLTEAAEELRDQRFFIPVERQGEIVEWRTLMTPATKNAIRQLSREHRGGSFQHFRYVSRYAQGSSISRAIMLMAIAKARMTFVKLGKRPCGRYEAHYNQGLMFSHPALQKPSDSTIERLAALESVGPLMADARNNAVSITMDGFKNILDATEDEIIAGLAEIQKLGYFTITAQGNSFTFNPTEHFHQEVWTHCRYPGGTNLSLYEREVWKGLTAEQQGMGTDQLPTLGYHFIYAITVKDETTGKVSPVLVGETTQRLSQRLSQHRNEASNGTVQKFFKHINTNQNLSVSIELLAEVHNAHVAHFEMETIKTIESELGVRLLNVVRTLEDNRTTVKVDSRLGNCEEVAVFLMKQQVKHGPIIQNHTSEHVETWRRNLAKDEDVAIGELMR